MAAPSIARPTPVFAGIDFGTTYSGLAYFIGASRGDPELVIWDPVNPTCKFPSKVTVSNSNILCGPQVPAGTESMEWFKLALLHHDDLDNEIRDSPLFQEYESFRRRLDLKASQVVQHLLKYMWGKFKDALRSSNPEEIFLFHLTVALPANWPQYTLAAMRDAVKKSGIGLELHAPVSFISEPEATTLATIAGPVTVLDTQGLENLSVLKFLKGDTVLVCDCGGGTVDLGAYTIINPDGNIALKECIPGTCRLNGAVKLDDRFIELLDKKAKDLRTRRGFESRKKEHYRKFANTAWELEMKPNFGSSEETVWSYEVPGSWLATNTRHAPGEYPKLTFTLEDLTSVFEPVFRIAQLVEEQIHAIHLKTKMAPKYVIISGGFGSNKYVQSIIRNRVNEVSQRIGHTVHTVILPSGRSFKAVCDGAAKRCLQKFTEDLELARSIPRVNQQIARMNYGIRSKVRPGAYFWFVSQGDAIDPAHPTILNLDASSFYITRSNEELELSLDVFQQSPDGLEDLFATVKWKPDLDIGALGAVAGSIQLQPWLEGGMLNMSILYRNTLQSEEQVTIKYTSRA
ncbi:hypothetical protein QQX98_004397 [Neonectria punicea]|uniref:Actin-like ATPase domain-containing protein n=1 Tax=Neonectria punicea TaxID=979145 RepID=A0ABR1H9C5_9HYPO